MKKRRLIAMLLCICMTASTITPVLANEDVLLGDIIEETQLIEESTDSEINLLAETSTNEIGGEFGDGLTWGLDTDTGLLTISGTGTMPRDWDSFSDAPWSSYYSQIVNVVVEEGVSSVAPYAFFQYRNLETIELPSTLNSIHWTSFMQCQNLKEINIEGATNFYSIEGVLFFDYNNEVTLICYPAQKDNTEYTVPDGVTHINSYAFAYVALENLKLPDSLKVIYDYAFYSSEIPTIQIPANVETMDILVFLNSYIENFYVDENNAHFTSADGVLYSYDMQQLIAYPTWNSREVFSVPEGVISIPKYIYTVAYKLKNLYISSTVEEIIETNISLNGNSLINIYVDDGNEHFSDIDGILFNKDATELMYYPPSKPETEYSIPSSTVTILENAFDDVENLETVIFHKNVSTLAPDGFTGCYNLTSAYFMGDIPDNFGAKLGSYGNISPVFNGVHEDFIIYYPENNTSGWTSPKWVAPDFQCTVYNTATFTSNETTSSILLGQKYLQTTNTDGFDTELGTPYIVFTDEAAGKFYWTEPETGTTGIDNFNYTISNDNILLSPVSDEWFVGLAKEVTLQILDNNNLQIVDIVRENNTDSVLIGCTSVGDIFKTELSPANVTVECLDTEDYAGNYRDFIVTFDSLPTNAYLQFDNQYAPNEWLSDEYCSANPAFIIDNSNLTETENGYVYKTTFIIHSEGLANNSYLRKVRVAYPTADGITYSEPFEFNVYPIPDVPQNKIGYAYAQTLDISDDTELPAITAVGATDENGYYRLTIATYTCDDDADVFFYWEADSGEFQRVSDDFSVVDFIPDGNSTVTAYMGDGLGYVASYTLNINQ